MTATRSTNSVTIWLTRPDPANLSATAPLVSEGETRDARRFHFAADRAARLASHALRRHAISALLGQPAETLRFSTAPTGRSYLEYPVTPLLISSTRRRGLVGFAAANRPALGLDLEETSPVANPEALLSRFLDPAGIALLGSPLLGTEAGRFAQLWSLIEACAKARNTGLTDDLHLQISLLSPSTALVTDGTAIWRCLFATPDPNHRLTLAADDDPSLTAGLQVVRFG